VYLHLRVENAMQSIRNTLRGPLVGGGLMALTLAGLVGPASAQEGGHSRDELLAVARRVMTDARYATLATVDESGRPQSRIMDPFPPDSQMVVWLGTNAHTRKVAQIRSEPRVALTYFDPATYGYVTLVGRATLVDDPAETAMRFKPEWEALYRDRDRDYLLIRVVPERLELVSVADGVGEVDPISWHPPTVEFQP
jgi:general stress protein 26